MIAKIMLKCCGYFLLAISPLVAQCLLFSPLLAQPATTISGPEHSTELWQGKALTATFRVGMCFAPDGNARGVLMLKHANGQEDVYHLYGRLQGNEFDLSHSSGHHFSGKLTGPGTMEGKARLKNGMTLNLKGSRLQNVRLLAEDCAPLPK